MLLEQRDIDELRAALEDVDRDTAAARSIEGDRAIVTAFGVLKVILDRHAAIGAVTVRPGVES